jgi:hypothetical protein
MWLNAYISQEDSKEYTRFSKLVENFFSDLELNDFDHIDLVDFMEFIPKSDEYAGYRGLARVLWNRYIKLN